MGGSFILKKNIIKAKYLSFEESPVLDQDIATLMSQFTKQFKLYKWNRVKHFTFDLTG